MKLFQLYETEKIFLIDNVRYIKQSGIFLLAGQLINPFYQATISGAMTWQKPVDKRIASITLDVMLAKRKMRSKTLAQKIGITEQNLSILKNSKAKAIRISTQEAICQHLDCQSW